MAELAGVLVGDYFLLECLAREGMTETYCARPMTRGGYDVVLRLFSPQFPDPTSFREHFAEEVEKVWRCRHEHIQPLFEFGAGDDLHYCATVLTDGETLELYLKCQPEQRLPVPLVLNYAIQLCAALQYAHEHGIVHGNVQLSSILMRNREHVMLPLLTHFGMRRAYQEGDPLVSHIDEGNAAYVAPEQALGMIRPASDVYAMGVLLFRLLSGKLPYDGEDAEEIALKHANEPIPSLRALRPDIPEALELVVRMALSKSPEARFVSPAALAQALHSAVLPESQLVFPNAPERPIVVGSRRTRLSWSRVASFLTLSVLLFSQLGAAIFVFSLPQRVYTYSDAAAGGGLQKENLFLGGSLALGLGSYQFNVGVSPEIGYSLNNWLRMAGPAFDASLALEVLGFTGPEAKEGVASHREKRKPSFPAEPKDF